MRLFQRKTKNAPPITAQGGVVVLGVGSRNENMQAFLKCQCYICMCVCVLELLLCKGHQLLEEVLRSKP